MAEFDVEVTGPHRIYLDLGYLDGGDHSRDIRDWRNLSLKTAKKLRDDLSAAIEQMETMTEWTNKYNGKMMKKMANGQWVDLYDNARIS